MNLKLILTALSVAELIFGSNETTTLSKEQVDSLKSAFKTATGQELSLTGLQFDADGYAEFSRTSLEAIESVLGEHSPAAHNASANSAAVAAAVSSARTEQTNQLQARIDQLQANLAAEQNRLIEAQQTIEKLGKKPEPVISPINPSDFVAIAVGINAISGRVWNEAALQISQGKRGYANALVASADVDIRQINEDLGAYYRESRPEINTFLNGTSNISSIFPMYGTGIKDELVITDLFLKNFLQPDNGTWTPKSGWEFQPEIIRLHNYKVDVVFTKDDLRQIITSWLAPMSNGSNPFQEPFVAFLTAKMIEKLAIEKTQASINGVYKQSPDGIPGPVLESLNGVYKAIQLRREEFRIKPFSLGTWNTNFESPQHIYRVAYKMYQKLPQDYRDAYPELQVLMPFEGVDACKAYEEAIAKNRVAGIKDVELWPSNLKAVGVPYVRSKVLIICPPGIIHQFYRQRGEDNVFTTQYDKRDTNIFMDGAGEVAPIKTGYKFKSKAEQTYEKQVIFLSDELDDYTYVKVDADTTILDAGVHNALRLGDNTAAVTITGIENAFVGGKIYLRGEATDSAKVSKILKSNTGFVLSADWTATNGSKLVLQEIGGKFVEIERTNASSNNEDLNAPIFDADETNPMLDPIHDTYMTAVDGSAVIIDDLMEAIPGKTYMIKSSAGLVLTTIASANPNFRLVNGDWKSNTSTYIQLYFSSSEAIFVETDRG